MPNMKVVLVTGVAGYLGGRVASMLTALPGLYVIGLDVKPPKELPQRLDFIQADPRNALLADLLRDEKIDTVCHLAFQESDRPNEAAFDSNVMGAIRLMGACAEVGVQKIVLASSTLVYGARADNSAFLTEENPLRGSQRNGSVRDLTEIESFCVGFRRQWPGVLLTVLRFAHLLGPRIESSMTRYLTEPCPPMLLGFDPMIQVLHEEDVVHALVHAILDDLPGAYNIAAEQTVPLSQLIALAGKVPVPLLHWGIYWSSGLLNALGMSANRFIPVDPDYLRYSCVADLARMHNEFGWLPHYTAKEALREFAGYQRLLRHLPEKAALAFDEERLRDTIERRRRARARESELSQAPDDKHYRAEAGALPTGGQDRLEDGGVYAKGSPPDDSGRAQDDEGVADE